MLVSVLGDMAHAVGVAVADRGMGYVSAAERNFAFLERLKPGDAVNKLRLAVAVDAGNADDLACAHLEGHVLDGIVMMHLRRNGHTLNIEDNVTGLRFLLMDNKVNIAADHHSRQLFFIGVFYIDCADILALAQDRAAVGDLHDLVELMRDKQDALALFCEVFHDLHELLDLLRGEHRGRLVENKYLVFAVEHFEYFGALLHTDCHVLDDRIWIDAQSVLIAQLNYLFARLILFKKSRLIRRLITEDDVIENREALNKLEVLVHHPDTEAVGIVGVFYLDLFAVFFDDTLFRLVQAEQNAHQGAFARSVFAEQGMYLAFFELKGNIIIGNYARKALGYMQHFYRICLFQNPNLPFRS